VRTDVPKGGLLHGQESSLMIFVKLALLLRHHLYKKEHYFVADSGEE
jgi:hypothetical protein